MPGIDSKVQGVDQLRKLAAGLKAFDDRKFKSSVSRRITKVVKPAAEPAAKEQAHQILPKRGGLNHMVDAAKVTIRTVSAGKAVGVTAVMRQVKAGGRQRDLNRLDQGLLRHPVHADPTKTRREWTWVNQPVKPGFFTDPMRQLQQPLATELLKVLDDVIAEVDAHIK